MSHMHAHTHKARYEENSAAESTIATSLVVDTHKHHCDKNEEHDDPLENAHDLNVQ